MKPSLVVKVVAAALGAAATAGGCAERPAITVSGDYQDHFCFPSPAGQFTVGFGGVDAPLDGDVTITSVELHRAEGVNQVFGGIGDRVPVGADTTFPPTGLPQWANVRRLPAVVKAGAPVIPVYAGELAPDSGVGTVDGVDVGYRSNGHGHSFHLDTLITVVRAENCTDSPSG